MRNVANSSFELCVAKNVKLVLLFVRACVCVYNKSNRMAVIRIWYCRFHSENVGMNFAISSCIRK